MTVEAYSYSESEEDRQTYDLIRSWSPETFPPGWLLPKLGAIVFDDLGTALCYICADMSNSVPRAFLDHLQTNPEAPAMSRFKAVKLAEEFICRELKRLGYHQISALSLHPGIASLAQSLDYQVHSRAFVHFQKAI